MRNTAIFVNKIELKKNDGEISHSTSQHATLDRHDRSIPRYVPRDKGLYPVNIFIHGITFGLSRYSPIFQWFVCLPACSLCFITVLCLSVRPSNLVLWLPLMFRPLLLMHPPVFFFFVFAVSAPFFLLSHHGLLALKAYCASCFVVMWTLFCFLSISSSVKQLQEGVGNKHCLLFGKSNFSFPFKL